MTNQTNDVSAEKLSVQHGLLIGGITVVLGVVFYMIDPLLAFSNYAIIFLNFAITITLLVVLGIDIRKKTGGYWSFGQAYKSLMIMAAVLVVITTLYSFVLIKFINPDIPQKLASVMTDKLTTQLTNMGVEQTKIDESTKQFTDGEFVAKMQPTLLNELKSLAISLAVFAVINLIIAASIKKKAPAFIVSVDDTP